MSLLQPMPRSLCAVPHARQCHYHIDYDIMLPYCVASASRCVSIASLSHHGISPGHAGPLSYEVPCCVTHLVHHFSVGGWSRVWLRALQLCMSMLFRELSSSIYEYVVELSSSMPVRRCLYGDACTAMPVQRCLYGISLSPHRFSAGARPTSLFSGGLVAMPPALRGSEGRES